MRELTDRSRILRFHSSLLPRWSFATALLLLPLVAIIPTAASQREGDGATSKVAGRHLRIHGLGDEGIARACDRCPGRTVALGTEEEQGLALTAIFNACYQFAWEGDNSVEERLATLREFLLVSSDSWPGSNGALISCLDILSKQV